MPKIALVRCVACALALLSAGCGLLDVSSPTTTEEADLSNSTGAAEMRRYAITALSKALGAEAPYSGLLADEFFADPFVTSSIGSDEAADRRLSDKLEELWGLDRDGGSYGDLVAARWKAARALRQIRSYGVAESKEAYAGQMFAVRGFATLQTAEDFCSGFPLNRYKDNRVISGEPLATEQVFERVLADFDSAVVLTADSARILHFAQIGRGRTLLDLGRFAEAAQAVASVPTDYIWHTVNGPGATNYLWWLGQNRSVADREGGAGLDFISAGDPRVQLVAAGKARDGVTDIYGLANYPDAKAPIVLASGIEARLIEAEAALQAGDASWLTILNDLRATQITPPLPALADPGTDAARLDLLFRERAFWLFATGHRLGDLRRLVRQYGRAPEAVFPTGAYRLGGDYDAATSLPFSAALESVHNPSVTGCTAR